MRVWSGFPFAGLVACALTLSASPAGARTISASNPNVNGTVSATYPATVARGVAFTSTAQATINDRLILYPYLHLNASPPGHSCPTAGQTELAPKLEIGNTGVPGSIQGRNSLDAYGTWTVCAYVGGSSDAYNDADVYAVGTIDVTPACTAAQASVTKAESAVRAARRALRSAKKGPARGRAKARLKKRERDLKTAKRLFAARVCPDT
jgi:hypothetical protein